MNAPLEPPVVADFGDVPAPDAGAVAAPQPLGAILARTAQLDAQQIEHVLAHQREHGMRFGEAVIALKYASPDDVLFALAQQFDYPTAAGEARRAQTPELVTLVDPYARQAESFRAIRSQLMARLWSAAPAAGGSRPALAVVSPASGDGKTFFAANLAVALAQLGGRTLLVDADLRGPRQHEVFALAQPGAGLAGLLAGRGERQPMQAVPGVPSLWVLTGGTTPPNPLELVERPAFAQMLRAMSARFDHVVVDTPAHEFGADGPVIASRCGAALIVARRHSSRVTALQSLLAQMDGGATTVAGLVLNQFSG